jgi:hypothetical protein
MQGVRRTSAGVMRAGPLALLLAGWLIVPAATAQPTDEENPFVLAPDCWVYYSKDEDGYYNFTYTFDSAGPQTVGIWATGGATTTPGASCEPGAQPGTGEICYLSFVLELDGTGSLDSFVPVAGITAGVTHSSAGGEKLSVNLSSATSPLPGGFVADTAPAKVGDLGLTVQPGTVVSLTSGTCLKAGLEKRNVVPQTMFVLPEPGEGLLLGSALLALGGLHWLRLRLAGRR